MTVFFAADAGIRKLGTAIARLFPKAVHLLAGHAFFTERAAALRSRRFPKEANLIHELDEGMKLRGYTLAASAPFVL